MDIEMFEEFLNLSTAKQRKLLKRILEDTKDLKHEEAQEKLKFENPQLAYKASYFMRAMHEVQKSGYGYALNNY